MDWVRHIFKALRLLARKTTSLRILSDVANVLHIIFEAFPPWIYHKQWPIRLLGDYEFFTEVVIAVSQPPSSSLSSSSTSSSSSSSSPLPLNNNENHVESNAMLLQFFAYALQRDMQNRTLIALRQGMLTNGMHNYEIHSIPIRMQCA
jgi:hypothetical protein